MVVLRRSHVSTFVPVAFPLLPRSIRTLDISENSMMRWYLQDLAVSLLVNLVSFKADDHEHMDNQDLLAVLSPSLGNRSLRFLSLKRCPKIDFGSLEWLTDLGMNLEGLEIGGNHFISDEMSKHVAKFTKLKYLGISYSSISTIGLQDVVNGSLGVLKEVDILGCKNVDLDVERVAAETGVKLTQRCWSSQ